MKHEFPTLYGLKSNGKVKKHNISVHEEGDICIITMSHGDIDGKQATSSRKVTEGKNIGKANETSVWEQAMSEASSKWEAKKKKKATGVSAEEQKALDAREAARARLEARSKKAFGLM